MGAIYRGGWGVPDAPLLKISFIGAGHPLATPKMSSIFRSGGDPPLKIDF